MSAGVAVIGVGGLGHPAAWALARMGVPLSLFDGDLVEASNLPRQILFDAADVGQPKAVVAALRLERLVPDCRVVPRATFVRSSEAARLARWPVWIDGTDSFATKLWLSDLAVAMDRTLVHGGATRLGGQALLIVPGQGPCLRCLLEPDAEDPAPGCREAGILGPVAGLVGAAMARLAFEALVGEGRAGVAVTFDAATFTLRERRLAARPGCTACARLAVRRAPAAVPAEL